MVHSAGIEGSGRHVAVGGFSLTSALDVDGLLSMVGEAVSPCHFQLFDADRIAGWGHLFFAAVNAVKAFDSGRAISKSLAMEVLLYASCHNQISQALETVGLSTETRRPALIVFSETPEDGLRAFGMASDLLGVADDSVLEIHGDKLVSLMGIFGVSEVELQAVGGTREGALTKLLVERGALLSTRR